MSVKLDGYTPGPWVVSNDMWLDSSHPDYACRFCEDMEFKDRGMVRTIETDPANGYKGLNNGALIAVLPDQGVYSIEHNSYFKSDLESNAKLIAAAPAMYEALKKIKAKIESLQGDTLGDVIKIINDVDPF